MYNEAPRPSAYLPDRFDLLGAMMVRRWRGTVLRRFVEGVNVFNTALRMASFLRQEIPMRSRPLAQAAGQGDVRRRAPLA
jgi:hypothetical protein